MNMYKTIPGIFLFVAFFLKLVDFPGLPPPLHRDLGQGFQARGRQEEGKSCLGIKQKRTDSGGESLQLGFHYMGGLI